ncbi:hypothetical protein JW960_27100 [candidate division KSB1 bacterium]|nr:hypothetical protein [candidate division KSB1 bacterium]
MKTATLKEITEEFGIRLTDLVDYEIYIERGILEIKLKKNSGVTANDPIYQLGKHPISTGIQDGSVNHDKFVYGNEQFDTGIEPRQI